MKLFRKITSVGLVPSYLIAIISLWIETRITINQDANFEKLVRPVTFVYSESERPRLRCQNPHIYTHPKLYYWVIHVKRMNKN